MRAEQYKIVVPPHLLHELQIASDGLAMTVPEARVVAIEHFNWEEARCEGSGGGDQTAEKEG